MKYVILLLLSQSVMADDWFCKSQTAKKVGNTMYVCGTGFGLHSEAAARYQALRLAQMTFQQLCRNSADCRDLLKISAEPMRADCSTTNNGLSYKCHQLIVYTLE